MSELEQGGFNPELQNAIDKGFPEAYVPDEVAIWLMGYENEIDDLSIIKLGYRFSPKAVRTMSLALCNGIYTEEGYFGPPNPQFRLNVATYAHFNDFISDEELGVLAEGKAIRGNLAHTESDLWVGPKGRLISNSVRPTVEEVAAELEVRRKENPDLKVVLFDGKFNGVPHPGYVMLFKDTTTDLVYNHNIPEENLVFVVACASDGYIRSTGDEPFLNTLSRMSLISYLPWPDYVCASGEFEPGGGLKHWVYKTQSLAPDYISIEDNHPLRENKILQARSAGATILTHRRTGVYFPTVVSSPILTRVEGPEVSSRNLKEGVVGTETERSFSNPYAHLAAIKQIRDGLYGKRDWFSSEQILLPGDLDKMKLPPEWDVKIPGR